MQQFLKIGKGNATMCISKGSHQCTGNYICEAGGGIKKEMGGRKRKEVEEKFKEPCV